MGKRGQRTYRIVVSEKTKDLAGPYVEAVGTLDPNTNPRTITLVEDRVKYWLSKGAQPSGTVHNIFVDKNLVPGKKVNVSPRFQKPAAPAEGAGAAPVEGEAAPEASKAEAQKTETPAPEAKAEPAPAPEPEVKAEKPAEAPAEKPAETPAAEAK